VKQTFLDSAKRCCDNSRRLLDEAELLEYEEPPATRHYLSMIAQEEAAKAFLLHLVAVDTLSWTPLLLRATRDHRCKQLVGIILDHMSPDLDEFLRRGNASVFEGKRLDLPAAVVDSMNILRHEKIGRWESKMWVWAEDPEYDRTAMQVAEGKRDKEKQRALYVELGKSGRVIATPDRVTKAQAELEYERARRAESCVSHLLEGGTGLAWDYERVEGCFRALFDEENAFIETQVT
jgi:AbiV family abortive infection protein